jgi:hypothetical protein
VLFSLRIKRAMHDLLVITQVKLKRKEEKVTKRRDMMGRSRRKVVTPHTAVAAQSHVKRH